ncbi:MAG: flagellar biosynthetic protein FliQ [Myxococcota bacterium]
MEPQTIGDLLQLAIQTTFQLAAPMLFVGLVIGVLISILQAATQVNEVTLVFIPKMLGVGLVMWLAGPWMHERLLALFREIALHIQSVSTPGF